jgi:hypothetical protein
MTTWPPLRMVVGVRDPGQMLRVTALSVTFTERSGRTVTVMRGMTLTRQSFPRRVRAATWSVAGLTLLVLAAALVLLGLDAGRLAAGRIAFYGVAALTAVLYAGTGRLIATRVPGNAIGWLLGLIGLSLAAVMLTEQYALHGLAVAPGRCPRPSWPAGCRGLSPSQRSRPWCSWCCCSPTGSCRRAAGGRCCG